LGVFLKIRTFDFGKSVKTRKVFGCLIIKCYTTSKISATLNEQSVNVLSGLRRNFWPLRIFWPSRVFRVISQAKSPTSAKFLTYCMSVIVVLRVKE